MDEADRRRDSTLNSIFSIVIPTCRRSDLLARCLDRLAPGVQALPADQYEVIVTDDGEPTVERFLAEKYPWASWSSGPEAGTGSEPERRGSAGPRAVAGVYR